MADLVYNRQLPVFFNWFSLKYSFTLLFKVLKNCAGSFRENLTMLWSMFGKYACKYNGISHFLMCH